MHLEESMKVNNEEVLTAGEFANKVGAHIRTIQKYDNNGKFPAKRTTMGRRYYLESDVILFLNLVKPIIV